MATEIGPDDSTLSPDEAFAALSDGTRMEILRTLADADGPLSFSSVYERVSSKNSGNLTYHLDKLVGHCVEETDEAYRLRRACERVIEAVVSRAVTETPLIDPTQINWPCSTILGLSLDGKLNLGFWGPFLTRGRSIFHGTKFGLGSQGGFIHSGRR